MSDIHSPGNTPHFIVTVDGDVHGQDTPENREIVKRIHACVNACQGLSTTELEQGIVQDMRRVISSVIPVLERNQAEAAQVEAPAVNAMKAPITINAQRSVQRSIETI